MRLRQDQADTKKSSDEDLTGLLRAWTDGEEGAADQAMARIYDELRRLARRQLRRERRGHTLQPTALVHEAYARLVDLEQVRWQDRAHFFAAAAQTMRRILIDRARRHASGKGGGGSRRVPLDELRDADDTPPKDLVAVDEALCDLARLDPRKADLVELRFFGGLSNEETAEVLGCSRATVIRQWRMARLWLRQELSAEDSP